MIKLEDIKALENNEGLTLKHGEIIRYKSGWQVADYGKTAMSAEECYEIIKEMNGECGIWLEGGIYYVDHSFRVNTKKAALEIGRAHSQISVYGWKLGNLAYC